MGVIRIRTEIPGPNSRELMKRRNVAVPRALAHSVPVFAASADGVRVIDVDENVYLDLAGGIGMMNVGHSAPSVVAAVQAQAERFSHVCFSVLPYESYVSLAERLARLSPGTFAKKTLLVNSGAEAIENAVKLARHATRRPGVLCFEDGFHGRTLLALSLTSKVAPYKLGYAPFVSDVMRVPYAYCYRCPYRAEYPSCDFACVSFIEDYVFAKHTPPEDLVSENYGHYKFRFDRGSLYYTQAAEGAKRWTKATYTVKDHVVTFTVTAYGGEAPNGAAEKTGEVFAFHWSKFKDQLQLSAVKGQISPENFTSKPWRRVGDVR